MRISDWSSDVYSSDLPRHHPPVERDRLGLVRILRGADLQAARLAVHPGRQFRRRDHDPDADHPRRDVSDRAAAIPFDRADAPRPAKAEGAAGTAQGRPAEDAAGAEEALPRRTNQTPPRHPT